MSGWSAAPSIPARVRLGWAAAAAALGLLVGASCVAAGRFAALVPAAVACFALALWQPERWWAALIALFFVVSAHAPAAVSVAGFWVGLLVWMAGCWMEQARQRRPVCWGSVALWRWMAAWLLLAIASSLHAIDPWLSVKEVARYALSCAALLTYLNWLATPRRARRLLAWLEAVLALVAGLFLVEALRQWPGLGPGAEVRLGANPPTASELALCFAGLLPIRVSLMPAQPGACACAWWRGLGVLGLLGGALALSGSRSACLAAAVGVAAACWLRAPVRLRRPLLALGVLIGVVGISGLVMYAPRASGPDSLWLILSGRDRLWSAAIRAVTEHPWLGVGPGNWSVWFSHNYLSVDMLFHDAQGHSFLLSPSLLRGEAHQLFLTKAAEMGAASALLLLGLLACWFRAAWRSMAAADAWTRSAVRGCLAAMLGWLAFGMFEHGPIIGRARGAEIVVVWLVAAIPLAAPRWRAGDAKTAPAGAAGRAA